MKKLRLLLLTLSFVFIININIYAQSNLPQDVRIGLYYLSKAQNAVSITSDTGFDYGFVSNNVFSSIYKEKDTAIVIKRDNYSDDTASYAYHIQVEKTFETYQEALNLSSKIKSKGYNSYPAYDGKWRVWVGVYSSTTKANTDIANLKKSFSAYTYKVTVPNIKYVQIAKSDGTIKFIFAKDANFEVYPAQSQSSPNVLGINRVAYRGSVRIIRQSGSDMTIVNVVNLEQYLYSVVGSEMPSNWSIEALKAQAVAARTYAVKALINIQNGNTACSKYGFDMNNTTEFQAYAGFKEEDQYSRRAVNETKGVVAYYNNQPIGANFFSSDGGYTENSENVWVSSVPYLRSVEDKYQSADRTHKSWSNTLTAAEIKEYLLSKGVNIGDVVDVQVTSYSKAGNALQMKIIGTKGVQEYKKDNIRIFFRYYKGRGEFLLSQTFKITKQGTQSYTAVSKNNVKAPASLSQSKVVSKKGVTIVGSSATIKSKTTSRTVATATTGAKSFTFTGSGYGHGVGMSQYGAKGMAEAGFTYDQILKYYYTGIELK